MQQNSREKLEKISKLTFHNRMKLLLFSKDIVQSCQKLFSDEG